MKKAWDTVAKHSGSGNAQTGKIQKKTPIDAYQELSPQKESIILEISRTVLVQKGCCEACVVPAAVCKAIHVAAGLALPQDVTLKITKD